MEYHGIVKINSLAIKLRTLKWQMKLFLMHLKFRDFKILFLIAATIFAIVMLYEPDIGPARSIYFENQWIDGKTLKHITNNKLLKPWFRSTSKNIFFHETSLIEDGIVKLNARQACAIESAALTNPNHNIFVMFASQVGFRNASELPIIDAILSYPNVHLNYLNISKYAENTPLEDWIKTDKLFRSKYVVSHTSDVLRFLSLFKYGGTYLDLDVVMLEPLDTQKPHNFAAAESDVTVAVGIIHMEGKTGHEIAEKLVRDLKNNFNGKDWANNGPWVLTRVLYELCGTKDVQNMLNDNVCKNFKVLPVDMCYDIGYLELHKFFEEQYLEESIRRLSGKLMTHVWNKASASIPLSKNENVAYIHLAKKYCPKTLKACDKF